jgi:pimeloyl-ACP methyl ester carboxylesterase
MTNFPLLSGALALTHVLYAHQACEKLSELKFPHAQVTAATLLPAGPVSLGPTNAPPVDLPERCIVKVTSRPTSDSEIKIEVWLPAANWNGRYLQSGNGGWAGAIPAGGLASAIQRGYAAAGTNGGHDTGHPDGPAGWAIGHPEKLIDFGHRALHETAVHAKAVIRAFYGKEESKNYFVGCSDGGREALMMAQRYPEDFNGIIAGAPANDWSNHFTGFVWNERALLDNPGALIPPDKLPAIQKAALAECDARDAVKDGLIEDPRNCRFDPAVLLCRGAESAECLTEPQIAALRKIYQGPRNPRTGKQIYPGYPPGHEAIPGAWQPWIIAAPREKSIQAQSIQSMFGNSFYGQAVFEDPNWDFRKLNFDTDVALAAEKAGTVLNSTNPDLRSFRAHGGKLIQYHGWADAAIAPLGSIEYYEKVVAFFARYPDPRSPGRDVSSFYRLFMVPGMGHCRGGIGPNDFGNLGNTFKGDPERDLITALERWVEQGPAPERFIGTGKAVGDSSKTLTRPLCAFPQIARYNGTGDPNVAASFTCAAPK